MTTFGSRPFGLLGTLPVTAPPAVTLSCRPVPCNPSCSSSIRIRSCPCFAMLPGRCPTSAVASLSPTSRWSSPVSLLWLNSFSVPTRRSLPMPAGRCRTCPTVPTRRFRPSSKLASVVVSSSSCSIPPRQYRRPLSVPWAISSPAMICKRSSSSITMLCPASLLYCRRPRKAFARKHAGRYPTLQPATRIRSRLLSTTTSSPLSSSYWPMPSLTLEKRRRGPSVMPRLAATLSRSSSWSSRGASALSVIF
mmetsp:Transcript_21377/g.46593  ORF Transcript_21377/g.46593 Transcript_21377/m.46593 type:complete len:250 (-) Transcript_21377:1039-1788(-)